MVLRWLREDTEAYPKDSTLLGEEFEQRQCLLRMIGSESIWTADLVLQIHQLFRIGKPQQQHAHYLFCSKTLQVEQDHQTVGYYRAAFGKDQSRVTDTFYELEHLGASMLCLPHLPLQNVVRAVCHMNCIAIVLVDNSVLLHSKQSFSLDNDDDRYVGHYVILCGISRQKEDLKKAYSDASVLVEGATEEEDYCLVLCNPGKKQPKLMHVTPSRFERSWRAKGTDDDIIFIARHADDS
jgi:hypothetical protein